MAEILKSGGSTKSHSLLRLSTTANHGTLFPMVDHQRCKSTAPTLTGGKSSSTHQRMNNSLIGTTTRFLMSQEEKMLKDKKLSSGRTMEDLIRNGRSSILTKPRRFQVQDLIQNSDSTEIDHSI